MSRIYDRIHGRLFGVDLYGEKSSRLWHRILIQLPFWIGKKLETAKLWAWYRFHPNHRYNQIDTRLPPGYYENDVRLLHGAFAVLCEHIEEEGVSVARELLEELEQELVEGVTYISEDTARRQIATYKEKLDLHQWWTARRPKIVGRISEMQAALYGTRPYKPFTDDDGRALTKRELRDRIFSFEGELEAQEQEMLVRLVSIRQHLWV